MPPDVSLPTSRRPGGTKGIWGRIPVRNLSDRRPGINTHQECMGSSPLLQQCFTRGVHREGKMAIPASPFLSHISAGHLVEVPVVECPIPFPATGVWPGRLCQVKGVQTPRCQYVPEWPPAPTPAPLFFTGERLQRQTGGVGLGPGRKSTKLLLQAKRPKRDHMG